METSDCLCRTKTSDEEASCCSTYVKKASSPDAKWIVCSIRPVSTNVLTSERRSLNRIELPLIRSFTSLLLFCGAPSNAFCAVIDIEMIAPQGANECDVKLLCHLNRKTRRRSN